MTIDDSTKANIDVKGMHKVKSGNTDDRKLQVDMCSVFIFAQLTQRRNIRSSMLRVQSQIIYLELKMNSVDTEWVNRAAGTRRPSASC